MTPAARTVDWEVTANGPLRGTFEVPGDKSISHRAVMLASIARGITRIDNFLEAADTCATVAICGQLGVRIEAPGSFVRIVTGAGPGGLAAPSGALDCGNSGTAMRLLAGLLAGQPFDSELIGDDSLSRRPMGRIVDPLRAMGAVIEASAGAVPPLRITGNRGLLGIDYAPPVASAQVKSAVLLAGLRAAGTTRVRENPPTRDYTESLLQHFGYPIEFTAGQVRIEGGGELRARDVQVPGDFSAAAFWLVGASLVRASAIRMNHVGFDPRRTGLWRVLESMGGAVEHELETVGNTPMASLMVRDAPLQGVRVPVSVVPDMIDEMPAFFVAAALAEGETLIEGATELRVKESDRIAVMTRALREMGADIEERADGALIRGVPQLQGATVESAGDHRCAMALAIAALRADDAVRIRDCGNVATSYPGFADQLRRLGASVVTTGEPAPETSR